MRARACAARAPGGLQAAAEALRAELAEQQERGTAEAAAAHERSHTLKVRAPGVGSAALAAAAGIGQPRPACCEMRADPG